MPPSAERTLRHTIAWSHDLLEPEEQALFARLAVFAGGFSAEAAEEVCVADDDVGEDVFAGIAALADVSLLHVVEVDSTSRYGMLETVREFGLEYLAGSGDDERVRARHAEWSSPWPIDSRRTSMAPMRLNDSGRCRQSTPTCAQRWIGSSSRLGRTRHSAWRVLRCGTGTASAPWPRDGAGSSVPSRLTRLPRLRPTGVLSSRLACWLMRRGMTSCCGLP